MKKIIIFPAFGFGGNQDPHFLSNEYLSQTVERLLETEPIEVYTDSQAFVVLQRYVDNARVCEDSGHTATATFVVFDWTARTLAQENKLEQIELIIVAAPQHQNRCVWCARQVGFKNIQVAEVLPRWRESYWDYKSLHWCTWGPVWWFFYQIGNWFAELLPTPTYRWLAKRRTH